MRPKATSTPSAPSARPTASATSISSVHRRAQSGARAGAALTGRRSRCDPIRRIIGAAMASPMSRILLVDDEPFLLEALYMLLRRQRPDWSLRLAPGSAEALAALAE